MIVKLYELQCPNCDEWQKIKRQAKPAGVESETLQVWVCENCKSLNQTEISFAEDDYSVLDNEILE